MGKWGQKSETSKQAPTRKTKAAVHCRQNNRMLWQCPSSISQQPPHHTVAVPTAMQNSHNDHSSTVGKQLKQKKSSSLSLAQHHLPALDLFWASFFVRVQLTSLLLILPGLCLNCICVSINVYNKRTTFLLQIQAPQGAAMLACS